jgi:hypothetical protein
MVNKSYHLCNRKKNTVYLTELLQWLNEIKIEHGNNTSKYKPNIYYKSDIFIILHELTYLILGVVIHAKYWKNSFY